ncbi:MAG: SIR2 family protein [Proteobacteria bacterium]|nr:SIR2 family protein [Pseudomonadota bacterium]
MEYLRIKFHEQLTAGVNINGHVEIEGYSGSFSPDAILQDMDEVGYEEVFAGWLEKRNEQLLDKADQILNMYDNKGRFNRLKEAYRRNSVIPFVGAGMSIPSGYLGWTKFLWQLREETRVTAEQLRALLNEGQYEEAAQVLSDDMPAGSFNEALENAYGWDADLVGPVQFLPLVFNSCAVTTNFDNVLKRCYEDAGAPFSETLIGINAQELPRYLGAGEDVLVKLHGKANSGLGRVLTYSEYQSVYGDKPCLIPLIEAVCNRTLLFLGCSLGVDRTLSAMQQILTEKGHESAVRHYAFVALKDDEDRLERRDFLAHANIFPIWYQGEDDHDDCIEALLLKLKEGV